VVIEKWRVTAHEPVTELIGSERGKQLNGERWCQGARFTFAHFESTST
jgi:hypothetical protein